jgi:hypothetical protein
MFNIEIKIGDCVKINPNSKYLKQGCWSDGKSMQGKIFTEKKDGWWKVKWDNDHINTYMNKDLIFIISKEELRDRQLNKILQTKSQ